ncbi:hypothetical protein L7F22_038636 [Adiantum nelumboides]|nr:hypothetical protein [Adiantum nelumboides]
MAFGATLILLISCLLLWVGLPQLSIAEIKNFIFEGDTRPIILFEKFGFSLRGMVNISISEVALAPVSPGAASPDPAQLGFFLATDDALVQVILEYERSEVCLLKNRLVLFLFAFSDLDPQTNSLSRPYPVFDANEYGLYLANCGRSASVFMNVKAEMYNLEGPAGGIKNFLPAGQIQLPALYLTFFFIYVVLLCLWIWLCLKSRPFVHTIHILMGALVFVKALDLICEAEDKIHIKATGTPHGWDVAFYVFSFLKGIMLFVVIVLIGTGWTILKPFLQDRERKVLMIVIPLQLFSNIASVVIDETGPFSAREGEEGPHDSHPTSTIFQHCQCCDWATWKQLLLRVNIACCCAVLFFIVWSIRDLKKAAQTDGKAARTLVKLTLFRQYYIVLFVYIYFALTTVTIYKYRWISDCAAELASLAFYLFTGYKFSPGEKNPYLAVDDDEEEAAAKEALNMDDFEPSDNEVFFLGMWDIHALYWSCCQAMGALYS